MTNTELDDIIMDYTLDTDEFPDCIFVSKYNYGYIELSLFDYIKLSLWNKIRKEYRGIELIIHNLFSKKPILTKYNTDYYDEAIRTIKK